MSAKPKAKKKPSKKTATKKVAEKKPAKPTKKVVEAPAPMLKMQLDDPTMRKLDQCLFKQEQLASVSRFGNKKMEALEASVSDLAKTVGEHLARLNIPKTDTPEGEAVFGRRSFNKLSVKLRKHSIDVVVDGIKFRCRDWNCLTHLIATQTLKEGIEQLTGLEAHEDAVE